MAQGIRSRSVAARLAAAWLLTACGDRAPSAPPLPTPRAVDTTTIPDAELAIAVLTECHHPLRGRMDRIAGEVHLANDELLRVFAQMPLAMRVAGPGGMFLVRDDQVFALGDAEPGATVSADQRRRLLALRTLLDAASFGPLHRATGCRRSGPAVFEVTQPTGDPWTVQLRPNTLLPEKFTRGAQSVVLLDYLRTSSTWIVATAEIADLGVCRIQFELADLAWAPDFFMPPQSRSEAKGPERTRIPYVPGGTEPRSATPFLVDGRAVDWVVLTDPGTWPARAAAYAPIQAELERQNQAIPGFPVFLKDGDRQVLAVPFRARDPQQPLRAPTNWQLQAVPAGRQLVVYPAAGDFAARCAAGERLLQEALAAQSLRATGPVLAQPFFHLEDGEPPADKLAAPVVRMSIAVQ